MAFKLNINGRSHTVDIEPETPLLWVLRDTMGLTGTKYGCGISACGACTVHVNGRAVKSCTMFAVQADSAELNTIESMGEADDLHPLQIGFWEEHGLQCGYCTPGMIMTTAQFLVENPDPSDAEIRYAIEGNLCRCTGYQQIVDAVQHAARLVRES